jgi:putative methionine-R-sulfoxide reductase with GAF domain
MLPPSILTALENKSLEQVLAATLAHFGAQAGTVHLLQPGAAGAESMLALKASSGIPPHIVAIVQTVPIGKGIAGLAAERREPITICNLQTDTSGQARPAARTTGMEGSIAVPMLTADGELRGVLGIAKAAAYDWSAEETALLMAIGRAMGE